MRSLQPLAVFALLASVTPADVVKLQHQPTFPFYGIGWRYEQTVFPPVTMAWAIELDRQSVPLFGDERPLFAEGPVEAVTLLGERKTIEATGGEVRVALGPCPIYFRPR